MLRDIDCKQQTSLAFGDQEREIGESENSLGGKFLRKRERVVSVSLPLPCEILAFEFGIFAHVRGNHPFDFLGLEEDAEAFFGGGKTNNNRYDTSVMS